MQTVSMDEFEKGLVTAPGIGRLKSAKPEVKEPPKEKIIPTKVAKAVVDYVESQRKRKVPERAIRRAVMRKWNINMK